MFTFALKTNQEQIQERLQVDIDSTKSEGELNKLILKLQQVRDWSDKGTDEWRAYTNAVVEAGKKMQGFKAPTLPKVSILILLIVLKQALKN